MPSLTRSCASAPSGVPSRSPPTASRPGSARISRTSPCASDTLRNPANVNAVPIDREHRQFLKGQDLALVWCDQDFNGFRLVSADADAGFGRLSLDWMRPESGTGCEGSPSEPHARRAGASTATAVDSDAAQRHDHGRRYAPERAVGNTAFPTTLGSERVGNTAQTPSRRPGRWQNASNPLRTDWWPSIGRGSAARMAPVAERATIGCTGFPMGAIQSALEGTHRWLIGSVQRSCTCRRQPKSSTRSLPCRHSPPSVPLTPKSMLPKALARSRCRDRPKTSGRLSLF